MRADPSAQPGPGAPAHHASGPGYAGTAGHQVAASTSRVDPFAGAFPAEHWDLGALGSVHVRHAAPTGATSTPALFVHGLGGSATNWTTLMARTRDDVDGWAVDLPGFGESPPSPRGDHSVAAHARAVVAVLERLAGGGGGPVHLLGSSMGGLVSVLVAAGRPELVRTLTLVSPALPYPRVPRNARLLALLALPGLGERLLARAASAPMERQVEELISIVCGDPASVGAEVRATVLLERQHRHMQVHAAPVFLSSLRSMFGTFVAPPPRSPWRAAKRITAPTLVIVGGRDTLIHASGASLWRRALPSARVVVLPTTGHVAMLERPDLVAELVRELWAAG